MIKWAVIRRVGSRVSEVSSTNSSSHPSTLAQPVHTYLPVARAPPRWSCRGPRGRTHSLPRAPGWAEGSKVGEGGGCPRQGVGREVWRQHDDACMSVHDKDTRCGEGERYPGFRPDWATLATRTTVENQSESSELDRPLKRQTRLQGSAVRACQQGKRKQGGA